MPSISLITPQVLPLGQNIRLVAIGKTDAGAPDTGDTATYALFDAVTGLFWNAAAIEWGAGRTENAMVEDGVFTGLYLAQVNPGDLDPGGNELDLVVEVTSNSGANVRDAKAIVVRHTLLTQKITDAALADPVANLGQLLTALTAMLTHKQVVNDVTKKLDVYRRDGVTVAGSFALTDAAGLPSVREPFVIERDD